MKAIISLKSKRYKGGSGSGDFGHAGRPGRVGGSSGKGGKGGGKKVSGKAKVSPSSSGKRRSGSSPGPKSTWESDINKRARAHLTEGGIDENNIDDVIANDKKIVSELAELSGRSEEEVVELIDKWNFTSNDSNKVALSNQASLAEEFGLELSDWQKEQISVVGGVSSSDSSREILRAMYDNTQQSLKDAGFKSGDKITLYRGSVVDDGIYTKGNIVSYFGNAMESWSASEFIADSFADDFFGPISDGVILSMDVPIENILSTARTGYGELFESEFVIFGNIPGTQVGVVKVKDTEYDD